MTHKGAAVLGAVSITAVLIVKGQMQGDAFNLVKVGTWLFLGALIGYGVSRLIKRKRS